MDLKADISCPACHSTDWARIECDDTEDDYGRPDYAICCHCATAWDPRTGALLQKSGKCSQIARQRTPLSDQERQDFARTLGELLARLGMDLHQPGTVHTPLRFVDTLVDLTAGYDGDAKIDVVFPKECRSACGADQVVESRIPFFALCEHHVLPFYGHATVGYVRNELIIGISKLTRIVRLAAKRFTQQERMGRDIADVLESVVQPVGIAVIIQAHHMCSQMRGVHDVVSSTRTIVWRGVYQHDAALQQAFLSLAGGA